MAGSEVDRLQALVDKLVDLNSNIVEKLERQMHDVNKDGKYFDAELADRLDSLTRSCASIMDKAERLIKAKSTAASKAPLEAKLKAAVKYINQQEPQMRSWCKEQIVD